MLLGRERELAEIDSLIAQVASGSGALALIEGPAGIGKSSLLAEASSRAQRSGMSVLAASGAWLEEEHAFGVVRELFRPVVSPHPAPGMLIKAFRFYNRNSKILAVAEEVVCPLLRPALDLIPS